MYSMRSANNIVGIEDYHISKKEDAFEWNIMIRMELLTGLGGYIEKSSLRIRDIVRLGMDICQALSNCEKVNIIHRDIKIDNVFVNEFGAFKLGDFGIAKQLEKTKAAQSQKGTDMYMAPEVYYGKSYDHTVDICSLGILMYRLLNNGRFPFVDPKSALIRSEDLLSAKERRMKGEIMPPPCDADRPLAEIVLRASSFHAKNRFQSAEEMKNALQEYLRQSENLDRVLSLSSGVVPPEPLTPPPQPPNPEPAPKHPFRKAGVILGIIVVMAGIILAVGWGIQRSGEESNQADVPENTAEQAATGTGAQSGEENTESQSQEETGQESGDEKEDSDSLKEAHISSQSQTILVGDRLRLRFYSGNFGLDTSSDLSFKSSDDRIAVIEAEEEGSYLYGAASGKVVVTATYKGIDFEEEFYISEVDEEYGMKVAASYDNIQMQSGLAAAEAEKLELSLSGNVPESFRAAYYCSKELDGSCSWLAYEDGILSAELDAWSSSDEGGILTILLYPEGEPEHVVGVAKIKVKVS